MVIQIHLENCLRKRLFTETSHLPKRRIFRDLLLRIHFLSVLPDIKLFRHDVDPIQIIFKHRLIPLKLVVCHLSDNILCKIIAIGSFYLIYRVFLSFFNEI
jgi:hypothetical protein